MEVTYCGEGRVGFKANVQGPEHSPSSIPKLLLCTPIVLGTHLSKPLVTGVA